MHSHSVALFHFFVRSVLDIRDSHNLSSWLRWLSPLWTSCLIHAPNMEPRNTKPRSQSEKRGFCVPWIIAFFLHEMSERDQICCELLLNILLYLFNTALKFRFPGYFLFIISMALHMSFQSKTVKSRPVSLFTTASLILLAASTWAGLVASNLLFGCNWFRAVQQYF